MSMWGKDRKVVVSDKIDTLIAANVTIEGDVRFSGGIQIDGQIVGNVIADGDASSLVRITDKGRVKGEIHGPNVIINGHVEGDVYSTEHIELATKAVVTGNVHYHLIEMVMGAEVNGSLMHLGEDKASVRAETMADIASVANGANKKADAGLPAQ